MAIVADIFFSKIIFPKMLGIPKFLCIFASLKTNKKK